MTRRGPGWWRRGGLVGTLFLATLATPTMAATSPWSSAAFITHCPAATAPRVVFPGSDPHTGSGPGAILWSGDPLFCPAAAASGQPTAPGVALAEIDADDRAGPAQSLSLAPGGPAPLSGLIGAAATGDGRTLILAGLGAAPTSPAAVLEGRADAPLGRPVALRALPAPVATATSYLGDVALATVSARTGRVILRVQRRAAPGLSRPFVLSARPSPVTALAASLDYRGDALVVWAQDGYLYRRVLRSSGVLEQAERIAAVAPSPHLQALISDDNRGIVAWTTDTPARGRTQTSVYIDASGTGVRFGTPHLLERFANPPGAGLPDGSLRLVRLASEGVMIAWTGMAGGKYVVRAAPVSLDAIRPTVLVSDPASDAVLTDLATGPHAEALALWTTAPRTGGSLDASREQITAARGVTEPPGVAVFGPPETIGETGATAAPHAAFDPTTDTAVAVWQSLGPKPGIAYAIRAPAGLLRRRAPAAPSHSLLGGAATAIAWGVLSVLLLSIAAVIVRRSRRRRRTAALGWTPRDRPHPLS